MKKTFAMFARGPQPEEFRADMEDFKKAAGTARNILKVSSRAAFHDYLEGPLMERMILDVVKAFPVPDPCLDHFTSGVGIMLLNAQAAADESIVGLAMRKRECCLKDKGLTGRDVDRLKVDLQRNLREVAVQVVQLQRAANDASVHLRHDL